MLPSIEIDVTKAGIEENRIAFQLLSRVRLFATSWTATMPGLPVYYQLLEFTHTHVH